MSCAFKLPTTSPGSQTASSFMNRYTACVRVTTQNITMSHFLCVLQDVVFMLLFLFILSIQLQRFVAQRLFMSCQPQCLAYFWICAPVHVGRFAFVLFVLMWMFGGAGWTSIWASASGGSAALGLHGGRAGAMN